MKSAACRGGREGYTPRDGNRPTKAPRLTKDSHSEAQKASEP